MAALSYSIPQAEQVPDGGQELRIVPGFGQVVARAFLHELDGRLQRRPGRQDQDGQVGVDLAHPAEQLDPFAPGRLAGREVHVLDDDADVIALDGDERLLGRGRGRAGDVVDLEEDLEGLRDGRLVLDDQDVWHHAHLKRVTRAPLSTQRTQRTNGETAE
jgi:hypothetical protein